MKLWKRRLSKVLAFVLCWGSLNFSTVNAQESEDVTDTIDVLASGTVDGEDACPWDGETMESVFEAERYNIYFELTDVWAGGYRAEITIENIDEKDIECWYLKFPFVGEISSIWNASVCQEKDGEIIVKNAGWNHKIGAGNRISFGVCVANDFAGFPENYELIGEAKEIPEKKYHVTYCVDSEWEDGYTGTISITNLSDETFEDWMLTFDYVREIEEIWCAELKVSENGHYVIENDGYNANIEAGQTVCFGFAGIGGTSENVPMDYRLSSYDWQGAGKVYQDTDGDGLIDEEETNFTWTDPYNQDTDGDGIPDGKEDIDGDFIDNKTEITYGTDPASYDTDKDNLSDYEELFTYGTNPIKIDTDGDGLSDYDDIYLGFSPLQVDSDEDGIWDGDEKQEQTVEAIFEEEEGGALTKVSVSLNVSGNAQNDVRMLNMYGVDMLSSNVVGLVGVPVEIKVKSEFDEAELVFHYDEAALGDVQEENLSIMWYDEENNKYHILDDESVVDTQNNTVSYVTTHFSTYMLVDSAAWYDAWREHIDYRSNPHGAGKQYYDIVFVTDVSYSMEGEKLETAKKAIKKFAASMQPQDEAAIVRFCRTAGVVCDFTGAKQDLYDGASRLALGSGTSVNNGLLKALSLFKNRDTSNQKIVILICDGDVNYVQSTIDSYVKQGIAIYAVNVSNISSNSYLEKMAKQTNGQYYYGETAQSVEINFGLIQDETVDYVDTTDTDGDGLYDVLETRGIRLNNGQIIYTDPKLRDTDKDGLTDYEETGLLYNIDDRYNDDLIAHRIKYFVLRSDPTKADTDGDGVKDSVDTYPWDHSGFWIADLESGYLQIQRSDGSLSRGGNQGWWADKASSIAPLNYHDFSRDKYYRLMTMGCGVIAMNDIELYLAQQNAWSNANIAANGVIAESDYRNYVEKNFDAAYRIPGDYLHYNTGLQPWDMEDGLKNFLTVNQSAYRSVKWAPHCIDFSQKELVLADIETMLGNNVPVVFSYYTFDKGSDLVLFHSLDAAKNRDYEAQDNRFINGHYMTIIGLYKYVNEEECENEYILKVLSWGEVYYIRYEEYVDEISYFSNIIKVF